jgi:hypothetical protein
MPRLGLMVTKTIVEGHNGTLTFTSRVDRGPQGACICPLTLSVPRLTPIGPIAQLHGRHQAPHRWLADVLTRK